MLNLLNRAYFAAVLSVPQAGNVLPEFVRASVLSDLDHVLSGHLVVYLEFVVDLESAYPEVVIAVLAEHLALVILVVLELAKLSAFVLLEDNLAVH